MLLLDEPFSALDAPLRRDLGELLRKVQHELRLPTVLVTHDAAEAASLADTVIRCDGGRVIRQCPPREMFAGPVEADPNHRDRTRWSYRNGGMKL